MPLFSTHSETRPLPPSPPPFAAVHSWASYFLRRYAEEHIQKTGVAIETQGFTFITSGRKRESLTVRTARRDCLFAGWFSWFSLFPVLLLQWARFTTDPRNIASHWKRKFKEFSIILEIKSQHPRRWMQYITCQSAQKSCPPCRLVILQPLQCGVAVMTAHCKYERPWETPASLSLLFSFLRVAPPPSCCDKGDGDE